MTLLERFNAKWEEDENGCWLWTASRLPHGYGRIGVGGKVRLAHRVSYELFNGPIPAGLDVDHLCHNEDRECPGGSTCMHRRCVNPAHLGVATRSENQKASGRCGGPRPGMRNGLGRFA